MTMTFKLDLDILYVGQVKGYLEAKVQVCMSVRSAVRARQTDRHTYSQTMPKLLHPSLTRDVKTRFNTILDMPLTLCRVSNDVCKLIVYISYCMVVKFLQFITIKVCSQVIHLQDMYKICTSICICLDSTV